MKLNQQLCLQAKIRVLLLLMACLCVGMTNAYAQQTVHGVVSNSSGAPMVGVTVVNQNNPAIGAITGSSGQYELKADKGSTLIFTYIGCAQQSVVVSTGVINVTMQEEINVLEEVVAIGYGTVKKRDILGSISSVKQSDLTDRTSGNVVEAMRGKVSGVKITTSGQPGSGPAMIIRGLGSLTNNSPLFIIDGSYAGSELGVNVEDIETIQILKDASSAAIYGSRAANGVVIVTTKQGKSGDLKVKFDANVTINWLPRYDLMNADTYKKYNDRAYSEAILAGVSSVTKLQEHYDGNTDWQDEMLNTGTLQNYNVSLSGGTETLKYYTSFNRMIDEGSLYSTGYDKYGFRVNTSGKKGIFSYGENFFYTRSSTTRLNGNPWSDFISIPPTVPVHDQSNPGGYGYGNIDHANSFGHNPVAKQDLSIKENSEEYLIGNIFGQISLFNMFDAKLNVAYKSYFGATDGLRKKGNWTMGQGDDSANLSYESARHNDILIEQTYNFHNKFGKHDVSALAGMSYNKFHEDYRWITKLDPEVVNGVYIRSLDSATGITTAGGSYAESVLISYMGRINYAYDEKYLMQLTARRDGTSKLPPTTRWSNFYAASLGWRISGENFFKSNVIDDLKIRANYGTLGNSSIGFWDYQSTINTAPRAVFGIDDKLFIGKIQSKLTNNDIRWERKTTINVGADLTAFRGRLTATVEYFYSKSTDLLLYLPILMSTGNEGGNPAVNAGSLSNRGFEIELGWSDQIGKNFKYYANINGSRVKNKVHNLGYGKTVHYTSLAKTEIGQSLGMWYLYEMDGIFQNQEEIDSHVNSENIIIQPNAKPGDIRYVDHDDNGEISSNDRHILGNPWPRFEMGINIGMEYKGVSLAINGYGRFGQMIYNGSAAAAGDFTNNQNNFNGLIPWTQENPVKERPRIVYSDSRNSRSDQNRWLEDGSFFRFSDITIAYNFPKSWLRKMRFENIRASVTLQNMITITQYSGLDPEFADGGIYTIGADHCSFPNPRAVQLGLSFTF